jgi:hypothetical protein
MRQNMTTVLYVLLMVIVIVGLDLVFFRDLFWERVSGRNSCSRRSRFEEQHAGQSASTRRTGTGCLDDRAAHVR